MLTPLGEMPGRPKLVLFQGLRITPNNNVIGGPAPATFHIQDPHLI